MHRRRNASALPRTQIVRSREAVRALRYRTRDAPPCAVRCEGDRPPAEPHEPQAGRLRARPRRGSGLTGVLAEAKLVPFLRVLRSLSKRAVWRVRSRKPGFTR